MTDPWTLPENPPPPIFSNKPEQDLQKQEQDELTERVLGQRILYYPIDILGSNFHSIYGECIDKKFLDPIITYVLVDWKGYQVSQTKYGADRKYDVSFHFNSRRVKEDLDLFVRIGDFILYQDVFYEIVELDEPNLIMGGHRGYTTSIVASCVMSRSGKFAG